MSYIRYISFDLDGVIFEGDIHKLRNIMQMRYPQLDLQKIDAFFVKDMRDCIMNKKDTIEAIEPYLKDAGWEGSAYDYVQFWHAADHCPNYRMLDLVGSLRSQGFICVTGTDQEKYRWKYIRETMGLEKVFDLMIAGCDLDAHKPTHKFFFKHYQKLCEYYPQAKKEEVLFVDDSKKNVDAAHDFGYQSFHFSDANTFVKFLENTLDAFLSQARI